MCVWESLSEQNEGSSVTAARGCDGQRVGAAERWPAALARVLRPISLVPDNTDTFRCRIIAGIKTRTDTQPQTSAP